MTSDAIKSQITVIAAEHPALHEFISLNKNKHFVSRKIKTILENALLIEAGMLSTETQSMSVRKTEMTEQIKSSAKKPIVEKAISKSAVIQQKQSPLISALPTDAVSQWQASWYTASTDKSQDKKKPSEIISGGLFTCVSVLNVVFQHAFYESIRIIRLLLDDVGQQSIADIAKTVGGIHPHICPVSTFGFG